MATNTTTPRQKLINMMYLVLTALLAMNVSKEILDSFITLDDSQQTTRLSTEKERDAMMATFAFNAEGHPAKFEAPYQKAGDIQLEANRIVRLIDRIKATCIAETEGKDIVEIYDAQADTVLQVKYIERKDDYASVTNILYGTGDEPATDPRSEDNENFRAVYLKEQLLSYKLLVSEKTNDSELLASMDGAFDFSDRLDADGDMQPWERINFYDVPLAATQTLLSKMQADVRNAELHAINLLYNEVEGETMKFTRLTDAVIPVTNNVSVGGVFQAEVFLAAFDDTNPPEIRLAAPGVQVDEQSLEILGDYELLAIDSNMIGGVAIPASQLGAQHREGVIIFKPAGLREVRKKFVLDYQVTAPVAMVNPTNMNVLYKGVDNPITVGVPGYRAEDISARIDNGSLIRASGAAYVARVTSGSTAKVSLSVQLPDGTTRALPPVEFRLKSVPDPEAMFGGKTARDSHITKAQLRAARGVRADIEGFLFPVQFQVISYDITAQVGGQPITWPANGNALSSNQDQLLDEVRSGARVDIENIIVRGPDGRNRKLASIALRVN